MLHRLSCVLLGFAVLVLIGLIWGGGIIFLKIYFTLLILAIATLAVGLILEID